MRVYNVAGELVRKVGEADVQRGLTTWEWDGRTAEGGPAANGIYFVRMKTANASFERKVVLSRR